MSNVEYVICEKQELEKIATALRRASGTTEQFSFDRLIGLTVNTINSTMPEITYVNQLPISTDADGNIYNEKGWKEDTYLSSGNEGTKTGIYTTGFIPAKLTNRLYCKNIGMQTGQDSHRLCFYDANKTYLNIVKTTAAYSGFIYGDDGNIEQIYIGASGNNSDTAYIRLCCGYIGDDSIITLNEEII